MEPEGMEQRQEQERPAEIAPGSESAPIDDLALAGGAAQMAVTPPPEPAPLAVAPLWHTIALVLVVLALSIQGASSLPALHRSFGRMRFYVVTAIMDLVLLGWTLFGLRLRRVSVSAVLGRFSFRPRALALDLGVAVVFWFGALFVLGSLGMAWTGIERAVKHEPAPAPYVKGQPLPVEPSQQEALRALKLLAPETGGEIAAWAALCLLVGFVEEFIFRGYLQRQFIALARGNAVTGVVLTSAVFGCAHAYQGLRNMVILAVFGAMFGVLALQRRSLRAGMMAHSWHDLCAGLAIALMRSSHLI